MTRREMMSLFLVSRELLSLVMGEVMLVTRERVERLLACWSRDGMSARELRRLWVEREPARLEERDKGRVCKGTAAGGRVACVASSSALGRVRGTVGPPAAAAATLDPPFLF